MKKLLFIILLIITITFSAEAQNKSDSLKKYTYDSLYYTRMRDSLMKVYMKQNEEMQKSMDEQNDSKRGLGSSLFSANLDVIFGLGFSHTDFDVTSDTTGLSNTESKKGPMVGATVSLNLLGLYFTTGFTYSSQGFKTANSENEFDANYFKIPLMIGYNFSIKKVDIDLSIGPYLGIRTSQDTSSLYQFKNIDIGIVGALQGAYFFNRFMGAMLGFKYEYGGLNNLLEETGQNNISAIRTRNLFIYTGMKFVL
jgi:outer membrane protein with beta-barrel domain